MATLMQEYRENEDHNFHTENYLLLAKNFGTPAQVEMVQKVLQENNKRGYGTAEDMERLHKEINPYYAKLVAECVLNEVEADLRSVLTQKLIAERVLREQKYN